MIDENTKILILGSLPSDISISQQQYYANPNNDFWKILSIILNETMPNEYNTKIRILQNHHIGLWDIYYSSTRFGSMDKDIQEKKLNDPDLIKKKYPHIELICFNGKEAGLSEHIFQEKGFKTIILPSSSGANRRNQNKRLQEWSVIKKYEIAG